MDSGAARGGDGRRRPVAASGSSQAASLAGLIPPPVAAAALDDLDVQIIRALREDARKSHRALSKEVPLSPPAIGDRIARMERLGVIRRYTVELGWSEAGYPLLVHMAISIGAGSDLATVVKALRSIPELAAAHIVTGQWDVLVRFRMRDQVDLQNVLLGQVWQIPGIHRVETNLELVSVPGAEIFGSVD